MNLMMSGLILEAVLLMHSPGEVMTLVGDYKIYRLKSTASVLITMTMSEILMIIPKANGNLVIAIQQQREILACLIIVGLTTYAIQVIVG